MKGAFGEKSSKHILKQNVVALKVEKGGTLRRKQPMAGAPKQRFAVCGKQEEEKNFLRGTLFLCWLFVGSFCVPLWSQYFPRFGIYCLSKKKVLEKYEFGIPCWFKFELKRSFWVSRFLFVGAFGIYLCLFVACWEVLDSVFVICRDFFWKVL